jgi:hypothetical protein
MKGISSEWSFTSHDVIQHKNGYKITLDDGSWSAPRDITLYICPAFHSIRHNKFFYPFSLAENLVVKSIIKIIMALAFSKNTVEVWLFL